VIIKVIERKTSEKSRFDRLGRYILNAKDNESLLFLRTAQYVVDEKEDGEKVAWYRISNCQSDTPAVAIAEVLATQSENQRTKSDKTYHLVVSFPHWERLSREQAEDIEDSICFVLGFAGHQRISAVHENTDHFHLHIAINKIHPTTFRYIEPYYPYYKLDNLAKELEIKHGLHQDNRIGRGKRFGKVGELEAHQQEESFLRWLHENLGDQLKQALQEAKKWQDIHDLLTAYGAVIKPRGAGLAIATVNGTVGIKASSLDRKLSFKLLTDRFGAYEPPQNQGKLIKQYQPGSRRPPGMNSLYAEFQKARKANCRARTKALSELRSEHREYRIKLKDWYRQRRASVKANTHLDNRSKRTAYHELSQQMQNDFGRLKQREQEQSKSVRERSCAQTWDQYLAIRAEEGHVEALGILRRRKNYRRAITDALLTVESFEDARDVIKTQFKPIVLRNGKVIYRAQDGGVVSDEATAITVPEVTEASTMLALSLADERFQGKQLVVEGSDEFKLLVAKLSAFEGMSVRLADPVLEKNRQRHVRVKELNHESLKEVLSESTKQPKPTSNRHTRER
jgi:Relaxase/Mobilisation nuclease domain/Large polyvalent protein-associated domain 7